MGIAEYCTTKLSRKKSIAPLFAVFLFLTGSIWSQNTLDSLNGAWKNKALPDSVRADALLEYINEGAFNSAPDSALVLANELCQFTKKINYSTGTVDALDLKGYVLFRSGNYPEALVSYKEGLSLAEEIDYKIGAAEILLKTGYIYHDNEDVINALKNYERSLKIYEEIGDLEGISAIYNEFGSIYFGRGNHEKALDYYLKGIAIHKEMDNEMANSSQYVNIGNVYLDTEEYSKALEYYQKALAIDEKKEDKLGIAASLSGMGIVFYNQGNTEQALDYLERSLKIAKSINDLQGSTSYLLSMSDIYLDQENYSKVIQLTKESLSLAKQVGDLGGQEYSYENLYEAYRGLGKTNEALTYYEEMIAISDSIKSEETAIKLQQMEFSKKAVQDSLIQVEKDTEMRMRHQVEVQEKDKNRNIAIAGALISLILAIGFFIRWRYVRKSRAIIEKEKNRSENLLLNILPAEIAEELKEKGEAAARDFDLVSILFTDFKGFTEKSAELSAAELIGEINHCFKAFDHICEKYGIEKIKTIGDAYMAAGGIPLPSDDAVDQTILAALEMQDYMTQRFTEKESTDGFTFKMRLGIHTGPVVAGIVGVKKFQYDIWGDTVNTASRMESSGAVGQVNISQYTYELVKDNPLFTFTHRGKINAKGKGEVDMWFVEKL
ncbi:adenylate/guanylate cyclase domain-containing protein [Maribacter sp. R77961]|uniref:adenylate/guanylate cyclase domain-containing protein n=1 Tax=Maribacter sp. R77961 TaxID=3093871 RepID=UPI0037CACF00